MSNIYVAWSRAREDADGHATAPVHLQWPDNDDRTLCGIKITARWELDVWGAENLVAWAGCMRCERINKAQPQ